MIRVFLFSVVMWVAAGPVFADPQIMSAPDAALAVASDEMILIDIRSPEEWAQTGVAQGAIALTMHNPEFPQQIMAILNADHGKSIGLICATGGRSDYVVSFLASNGFEGVVDVSEGMMVNGRGAGWIARGMPLISAEDAQMAYQSLLVPR